MKGYRVWAEINLGQLKENLLELVARVGPAVKVLVVVKADAYGHGAVPVARTVLENGATMLGVGDSNEAIQLRQSGILAPILILGALIEEEIGWIVSYDITPTIHSMDLVALLNDEARRQNKRLKVHLKVDTGLTRLGASPKRAVEIAHKIVASPHLVLEGLSTHFAASADPKEKPFTERQVAVFTEVVQQLEQSGIQIPLKHIANTGGIYQFPNSYLNMVRPGGMIYGIDPGSLCKGCGIKFNSILALKSQITFIKTVPAGTSVGYGMTYRTKKRSRIATIPIGYNDGYPYHLANKGVVLIQGRRIPVVGHISMDYITVDITGLNGVHTVRSNPEGVVPSRQGGTGRTSNGVKVGEEVVLIGQQGQEEIRVEELGRLTDTLPYVITCGLGKRVHRVYL